MEKKIINGSELANKKLEVQENGLLKVLEEGRFIPKAGESFWALDIYGNIVLI